MQQHYQNKGNKETIAGKYYCYKLIYYERFSDVTQAIEREKDIKDLSREKKQDLIAETNPNWNTLVV